MKHGFIYLRYSFGICPAFTLTVTAKSARFFWRCRQSAEVLHAGIPDTGQRPLKEKVPPVQISQTYNTGYD